MAEMNWLWMAQYTVRHNLSANAGLRLAQEYGLGVRRATWLQAVGQIRTNNALRAASMSSILTGLPSGSDIGKIPTGRATGYIQYASVAVRDKNTGLLSWKDQAVHTPDLLSREQVIDLVVARYRSAVDMSKVSPARWGTSPDEVVEGGMYITTLQMDPKML